MATVLDIGFISNFSFIFPFLLVFVVVFGFLSWRKVFDDNKLAQGAIAILIALIALMSSVVIRALNKMAGWFVVYFFGLMFIIIAFKMFGISDDEITSAFKGEHRSTVMWVLGIALVIIIGSIVSSLSEEGGVPGPGQTGVIEDGTTYTSADGNIMTPPTQPKTQESAFWNTITHPKVLGLILILLIASFALSLLTKPSGYDFNE